MSVASTYAEALFEAAGDADAVDAVAADLAAFVSALADSPDLRAVLEGPDVALRAKRTAVAEAVGDGNPTLASFLRVILDRGRIAEIDDIARAYARRVDDAQGRIAVEAVTAIPLPDDLREAIIEKVERESGRTAVLTERVEPDIIGGLILRVGGVMLDASARRHLDALRRGMASAPIPVGPPSATATESEASENGIKEHADATSP